MSSTLSACASDGFSSFPIASNCSIDSSTVGSDGTTRFTFCDDTLFGGSALCSADPADTAGFAASLPPKIEPVTQFIADVT